MMLMMLMHMMNRMRIIIKYIAAVDDNNMIFIAGGWCALQKLLQCLHFLHKVSF